MLLRAIWSPDRWRVRGLERSDRCNKCNRWYKCNILPITPISLIPPITLILFHGTRTAQPKQGDLWKLKSFSPCNAIYGEAEYLWKINILYSATPLLSESALRRKTSADNIRFCVGWRRKFIYISHPTTKIATESVARLSLAISWDSNARRAKPNTFEN